MAQPEPGTLFAFLTKATEPRARAARRHPLVATLAHACVHLVYGLVTEGVLSIADRWLPAHSVARQPVGDRVSEVAKRPARVS